MGVFFAPRLYEAFGENFYIIAGGERKKRLESRGVTINGVNYRFPIVTPEEQGEPADLILIGVKGYGFAQAIEDIRHQVGEHTLILSLLNGVDSEEQLIQAFGEKHVLYAYMRMSIVMKDGKADFDPYWGKIHFGENKNDVLSDRVLAVKEVFDHADIPYEIDPDMLKRLRADVGNYGACVAAMPVKDTIKIADNAHFAVSTPDRNTLWMIQTPQVFDFRLIWGAYCSMLEDKPEQKHITDDAMLVECYTDKKVYMSEGSYRNIKVTTPEDIGIAELFLKK